MPDQHIPQLRTPWSRLKASRPPRSRLRTWLAGSLAAHLLALALVLFVRVVARPPEAQEQPSFGMMFEPSDTKTKGAKTPTKYTSTPDGEKSPEMHPTPQSRSPPPSPAPAPQPEVQRPPEVNLLPPEYQQAPEPPPPQEQAEPVTPAERRPKTAQARPRSSPSRNASRNPFANPMQFSYAPQARPGPSGGIRGSRSLDLSAGPVIAGGRLQDAVQHVIGPGGSGDYMEALSEFIELHKYYPPSAARNGEQGTAVVRVTIERDGTVKAMRLLGSSGSPMLDAAWEAVFRDNRLPPFPDDLPGPQQTFTLSLDYELIYR